MKFELGQTLVTRAVHEEMEHNIEFGAFIQGLFYRYIKMDWGAMVEEDLKANDYAVDHEERILASYSIPLDIRKKMLNELDDKIWIITEWDRSVTTVLFPSDY